MRKAVLLALALVLLSGCVLFPPEEQTKYEIFSNLPSEGVANAVLADVNGDAFAELISLIGTAMGGKALKNLHGAQLAVFTYEDGGSAAVIKLNTTMELNELMESLPGGYEDLVNETKQINGKQVVLLYSSYDKGKENPLCVWREGEWLNFLYYQQGYSYVVNENVAEKPSINESLRCDFIMEKKYDTKKAEQLLAGSAEMKKKFSGVGKFFGDGMAYIENSSAYVSLFGDENGDYAVAMLQGKRADSNLCYNDSSSGGGAEVVKRGNKEACLKEMKESSSSYIMPMSLSLIYLERRVGDYSLVVVAYVKEKKDAVINKAENIIFGLEFPGEEARWTDKMTLTVKVYENDESFHQMPVADAKVNLYKYGYSYIDYEYGGMNTLEPIKSAKTDDNGIAKFTDLEIGSYTVEASKEGYLKGTDYVYQGDTNSSIMLRKLEPLRVNVREGSYSSSVPVAEAKVVLYNGSSIFADGGAVGYTQNYEVIDTKYTNASGVADFGKRSIENGKIVVSKESYDDYTTYLSTYSRNITVYLTKKYNYYNYSGKPFTVTVRSYDASGLALNNIEGAKVSIYNKTSIGNYTLATTNYTDSDGVARLNGGNIMDGKIEVEKEGYRAYSEYFYYYNTRNIMVYLSLANLNQTYGYNKTSAPAENCIGNYSLRVWPSEAATATCTGSNGAAIPSTGENAADWFNYGGCGGWKTYNVTPGSQVMIHGYSDSCAGCSLWHINYYLQDYYNSSWRRVGYVDGPDERGATYDFCYTPKGNRIDIEAETGFYVSVFKKG
ncbi:MAG: hypothetical protein Sv326_0702 [Candidatus Fermentimicrarchaeum limneticum]|uniref:Uncharacterized protein n=1 Tax=Fermentimicrarchaeum limneticum TaxID=2795018 RepID=A0A7D6BA94_FERL1|nr:MAG: hypothetical protein Sv326_0702 [Candidatus Fermentimicrarchaeum limneticum]